jgi:hypothetical protein
VGTQSRVDGVKKFDSTAARHLRPVIALTTFTPKDVATLNRVSSPLSGHVAYRVRVRGLMFTFNGLTRTEPSHCLRQLPVPVRGGVLVAQRSPRI